MKPVLARFFKHITFLDNGCWIWKNPREVARCSFMVGKHTVRIRPWVYSYFEHKTLPGDHSLFPSCGNSRCVAPLHLQPKKIGQLQTLKTHCPHGHPYDGVNTYHYVNALGHPARNCKTCMRERERKRTQKRIG